MKKLILEISESEKRRILQMHENASRIERGLFYEETAPEPAIPPKSKTPFTLDMDIEEEGIYAAGDSDPSAFIDIMLNKIVAKINENPQAKALLEQKKLVVKYLHVYSGSSNRWGTKQTSYDRTRASSAPYNLNTEKLRQFSGDPGNKLYQLNKDLANKRAKNFAPKMIAKLKAKGIAISENTKQSQTGAVINTNGKLDKDSGLPYKGQFVRIYIGLANKVDVDTFRVNITKLDDIKEGFVMKGYYTCAAKTSEGNDITKVEDTYLPMCKPLRDKYLTTPSGLNVLNKTLGSFEIKWNPNIMNEPYVVPVRRWLFNWIRNSAGRMIIKDVSVIDIKKIPIKYVPPGLFAEGNKPPTDPELKYLMNLGGAGLWDKFVAPYLS